MSVRWRMQGSRQWLTGLWAGALDLALPPACAGCMAPVHASHALCEPCDRRLPRLAVQTCALCQAVPVPPAEDAGAELCAHCDFLRSPLTACLAAASFSGDVASWIHRFKYPRSGLGGLDPAPRSVVDALVMEAADRVVGPLPDLVVPVPLHPSRLRARGFNPAGLLARAVARENGLRFDPVALRRLRATESQTGLDRDARRNNVRGAFRTQRRWRAPSCVWVLDDVVTTGSTLSECAHALRRAGATTVIGICAARTLGTDWVRSDPGGTGLGRTGLDGSRSESEPAR